MSRTRRNQNHNSCIYRRPKTKRELTQQNAIMNDPELKEYNLGKRNRVQGRHIPTFYDDIVVSSWNEMKWSNENFRNGVSIIPPESNLYRALEYLREIKEMKCNEEDLHPNDA